jgi:hypothetical protein
LSGTYARSPRDLLGSLSPAARRVGQSDDHRAGETSDRQLLWAAGCGGRLDGQQDELGRGLGLGH